MNNFLFERMEINNERWFDLTPLLNEEFRDIKGYEGQYQVSNYGRIKSLCRLSKCKNEKYKIIKEKILRVNYGTNKYAIVTFSKNKKIKTFEIHRLVAEAFIPNPDNLPCVNHRNEIKNDNRIENLEWCTYSYNNSYNGKAKKINEERKKPVLQFNLKGKLLKEYNSITEASLKTKYDKTTISKCCNNIIKKSKKYLWKFKESEMEENGK